MTPRPTNHGLIDAQAQKRYDPTGFFSTDGMSPRPASDVPSPRLRGEG